MDTHKFWHQDTMTRRVPASTEDDPIRLHLSVEEGRWLLTAVGIAQRLLGGLSMEGPHAQWYQLHGLAALHRIAQKLPAEIRGYYP
jgi:hypothetical protein